MSNTIIFYNRFDLDIEQPVPAKKMLPEWYKNIDSYVGKERKPVELPVGVLSPSTIKRCMPVFDVLTSGYIIKAPQDIYIDEVNGSLKYYWASTLMDDIISFHAYDQVKGHPMVEEHMSVAKFTSPWSIKTPKGYSCLFIPPVHRNNIITIFPGIVDTDQYNVPVEFPFTLTDPNFRGMIPIGTPLVQVIPFKRENWNMVFEQQTITEYNKSLFRIGNTFFDKYKNKAWSRKEFN